jgi:hypothetical protein
MSEIFSNPYKTTRSWSAQSALVTWYKGTTQVNNNGGSVPLIMEQLAFTYRRTAQFSYPINAVDGGTQKTRYEIFGVPIGQLQIQSLYSPFGDDIKTFLDACAKSCKGTNEQVNLVIRPTGLLDCETNGTGQDQINLTEGFRLGGVSMDSVGLSIVGGELSRITMPLTFNFSTLDWDLNSTSSATTTTTPTIPPIG